MNQANNKMISSRVRFLMNLTRKQYYIILLIIIRLVIPIKVEALEIQAIKTIEDIPLDPTHYFWSEYGPTKDKSVEIDLGPQLTTKPFWPNPSTKKVKLKAIRNDTEIAIWIEWHDPTLNNIMIKSGQYKDQAAIMFPVNQSGELPLIAMGSESNPVNIWQWKAVWQKNSFNWNRHRLKLNTNIQYSYKSMDTLVYQRYKPSKRSEISIDLERVSNKLNIQTKNQLTFGTNTVSWKNLFGSSSLSCQDLAKNYCNEESLGIVGKKRLRRCVRDEKAALSDNSSHKEINLNDCHEIACRLYDKSFRLSSNSHQVLVKCLAERGPYIAMTMSPIEEFNSYGPFNSTSQAKQSVDGHGVWRNKDWSVVFKRSLITDDNNDTQFIANKTPIAIAIWDGGNKEKGPRKAISNWHELLY